MVMGIAVGAVLLLLSSSAESVVLRPWRRHFRCLAESALVYLSLTGTAHSAIPSIDEFYVTSGTKIRDSTSASLAPKQVVVLDVTSLKAGSLNEIQDLRKQIESAR